MPKLDTKGLNEAMANLRKTGKRLSEKEVEAILQAGGAEYVKTWKKMTAERHTRTGQMRDAVGMTAMKVTAKDGAHILVYPMGNDSRGVSNMKKAIVAHAGRKRKKGAAAQKRKVKKGTRKSGDFFITIAETMAKESSEEAMQRKFDEIINKEG